MIVVMILVIMLVLMVTMVVMGMHLAVKVLRFAPHQGRSHRRLNRETAAIAQTPLEHASEETIEGIMTRAVLKVVVETGMPLNRDDWREIKLSLLQSLGPTASMTAMGQGCRGLHQRKQEQGQKQASGTQHGSKHGTERGGDERRRRWSERRWSERRLSGQRRIKLLSIEQRAWRRWPCRSGHPDRSPSCRCSALPLKQRFAPAPRPRHRSGSSRSANPCSC